MSAVVQIQAAQRSAHEQRSASQNHRAMKQDFAIVSVTEWLVLRCASSRTMALAAALAGYGAWTPTWKRKRRLPRSPVSRVITEAALPSFVFIPAPMAFDLPHVPRIPFGYMKVDGVLTRIADRELDPLRQIAERPLTKARNLPKPGTKVRFNEGPFEGLRGKVLACTQRYATIAVDGFGQPIQVPPLMVATV